MTADRAAATVRSLRAMEPYECRMIETGRGYARTVYAAPGDREAWWVVSPGDAGPRWAGLAETLAEMCRYPTEAAWEAAIPPGDPMF